MVTSSALDCDGMKMKKDRKRKKVVVVINTLLLIGNLLNKIPKDFPHL
jgi:hypothetical protein